ncbi:cold-regulated 413 inner membrane protein 1, chloroplastic-like [Euphorbia lathyris]|uniref:cold-regulated 413 inner membrane protein 1, chloroplastic-like n=1 Tax=Euphorbia lathyris TaxID=212925 RepID=UPI003313DCA5
MLSLCLSSSSATPLALHNKSERSFICMQNPRYQCKLSSSVPRVSSSVSFNPLRFGVKANDTIMQRKGRGFSAVCYAGPIAARNMQWISTICSVVLMLAKGTAIHKSFLVPIFALQAPSSVISWIKGEYGIWTAFMTLLVRLFFFIPGELDLPFMALLFVIVAPHQVMNLRGTQQGAILALVIAGYLAFQHFSRAGKLQNTFEQGSIVATLAIICVTVVSCLFLI